MSTPDNAATMDPPTVILPPNSRVPREFVPNDQLEGREEFGTMKNWMTFDPQRGKMMVRSIGLETDEFIGTIIGSKVVRVMKDPDGNVLCASSDRQKADEGRPGRVCATCEDKDVTCFPRWWIAWQELESGLIYAHTLSQSGSMNFNRFFLTLERDGLGPGEVVARIFVEEAKRKKANTLYRRIQFERVD
jgi:hypothetical protein